MEKTVALITGHIYHVYSKSIYGYRIFNRPEDYQRMLMLIRYYQSNPPLAFCRFLKSPETKTVGFNIRVKNITGQKKPLVNLISYCIMQTHVHLIIQQTADDGISRFTNKIFGGYSQYFNLLHNRRGPLWQSRFGRRHIAELGDLISTSHYIHANPVKDMGLLAPEEWMYSSYREYCGLATIEEGLCSWQKAIPLTSQAYQDSMRQYLLTRVG